MTSQEYLKAAMLINMIEEELKPTGWWFYNPGHQYVEELRTLLKGVYYKDNDGS